MEGGENRGRRTPSRNGNYFRHERDHARVNKREREREIEREERERERERERGRISLLSLYI